VDHTPDPELRSRVKNIVNSWDPQDQSRVRPHVEMALVLTEMAYQHLTDTNVKVAVTLCTVVYAGVDNPGVFRSWDSGSFHRRHCAGTAQNENGVLGYFTKLLANMWSLFPTASANTILTASLRCVNGALLEYEANDVTLASGALPFVRYRRQLTGIGEAYGCFIWEGVRFPDHL